MIASQRREEVESGEKAFEIGELQEKRRRRREREEERPSRGRAISKPECTLFYPRRAKRKKRGKVVEGRRKRRR